MQRGGGCAVVFDAAGPFAGAVLVFAGQVADQEVVPLFHSGGPVLSAVT
jgi:hypothetical protein